MSSIEEFKHLQIPLQDIKSATNNFGVTNCIGEGGFGKVYQGQLVISEKLTTVAIKRLNTKHGQGAPEFWREIMLLSNYKHENLVTLLGFSDEGGESILVYEFLPNKSLDLYLRSSDLSWNQRLRICIGAARGLQYLHAPAEGTQQRVLHRDIKSANILLDHNWNAKIADFGFSKYGPANQQHTFLYSAAVGTMGYCDPLYMKTGFLTKESDVYSFGAVLFEVLCGRPCVQMEYEDNRRILTFLAKKCYKESKLDTIIDNRLKEQISPLCLERFSKIAYQCLLKAHTERPTVTEMVKQLEIALGYQEEYERDKRKEWKHDVASDSDEYWETKLPQDWEAISNKFSIPSAIYTTRKELFDHLHKGIRFDDNNRFFWINDDGKKCEFISARRFLDYSTRKYPSWEFDSNLRVPGRVAKYSYKGCHEIRCQVKTSMLSLGTMYAAILVVKFDGIYLHMNKLLPPTLMRLQWKSNELSVHSVHCTQNSEKDAQWYEITMWHFMNYEPNADFDVVIEKLSSFEYRFNQSLLIQGIKFQPIEMRDECDEFKGLSITNEEDIDVNDNGNGYGDGDGDEYWEKKLPEDYARYIKMSDKPLGYTTKKELYLQLCEGFSAHYGQMWLSVQRTTRGICFMLPATDVLCDDANYERLQTLSSSASRFGDVKKLLRNMFSFDFKCRLWSPMFQPKSSYAAYLVFKFQDNRTQTDETCLLRARCKLDDTYQAPVFAWKSLPSMNIPTITPKNDYQSHDSSIIPGVERLVMPKACSNHQIFKKIEVRNDGWLEVMLCKPLRRLEVRNVLEVKLHRMTDRVFDEMIIEGIEFRPCI